MVPLHFHKHNSNLPGLGSDCWRIRYACGSVGNVLTGERWLWRVRVPKLVHLLLRANQISIKPPKPARGVVDGDGAIAVEILNRTGGGDQPPSVRLFFSAGGMLVHDFVAPIFQARVLKRGKLKSVVGILGIPPFSNTMADNANLQSNVLFMSALTLATFGLTLGPKRNDSQIVYTNF